MGHRPRTVRVQMWSIDGIQSACVCVRAYMCVRAHNVSSFFSLFRSFPAAGALFFIRVEPPPPPTSIHIAATATTAVTFSDHVHIPAFARRRNRNVCLERGERSGIHPGIYGFRGHQRKRIHEAYTAFVSNMFWWKSTGSAPLLVWHFGNYIFRFTSMLMCILPQKECNLGASILTRMRVIAHQILFMVLLFRKSQFVQLSQAFCKAKISVIRYFKKLIM